MQSFTGPEIAALLEEACIIASGHPFSEELQRQIQQMPSFMHHSTAYHHWIDGVYLITGVKEDERQIEWHVEDEEILVLARQRLGESLGMWYRYNICICIYIYIYTYIHTYIHTHTHTHSHTHTHVYIYNRQVFKPFSK
jgi:hypothetical protein